MGIFLKLKNVKKILIIIIFLLSGYSNLFSQRIDKEILCCKDTFVFQGQVKIKDHDQQDSVYTYQSQLYKRRSIFGLRLDLGFAKYSYNEKTASWLGNHGGPVFNFSLALRTVNFGVRFKPWTINPQEELSFNGVLLPKEALLNPVKLDYYIAYSFDFKRNISIEPSVGYTMSYFKVINEDKLGQHYSFSNTEGPVYEITINKYFEIQEYEYFCVFGSVGFANVDFKKVHENLDNGYIEYVVGIAFKDFFRKKYYKKID